MRNSKRSSRNSLEFRGTLGDWLCDVPVPAQEMYSKCCDSEKVAIKRGQSQVYLDYAERKRVRQSQRQVSLLTKVNSFDLRSVDSSFDSSMIYPLGILSPLIGAALKQGYKIIKPTL